MTRADLPIGALLLAAGLWLLWQASLLPYGSEFAPGSGFAPLWLSLLAILLTAALTFNAWRRRLALPAAPSDGGRTGLARVAASLGGLLALILLVNPLGLVLALLVYLLFLSLLVERLAPLAGLAVSLGTVGFVYLVFVRLLSVPFPAGPLGF